jgi:amidase
MNKSLISSILLILTGILILFACQSPSSNIPKDLSGLSWLEEMTINEMQQGYREGKFTVTEVVTAYIERINQIDKTGPSLNSIIAVNPDAMQIAGEMDREISAGKNRGPLHGIPVILKDNIDTHDKMPTTAGSAALRRSIAKTDSYVAAKLRDAGAVIIAKANLSEWANFRTYVSSSGWSGIGGQTRNPYVLDRNPCGSSSGSGVAVSANLCMIAIGTETNGSIVCPSNNNGIVGIKPTVGLISRSGIVPISFTQDTPGPMSRTVADAAICLGALTGIDSSDSKTEASVNRALGDYTSYLKADGLNGKRIGVIKNSGGYSESVDRLMLKAIEDIKSKGAEIIEVEIPWTSEHENASLQVLLYEFKDGLNKYLGALDSDSTVRNLNELIEFNKKDPVELKYFDQKIFLEAESKGDLNSPEYLDALNKMLRASREEGIDRTMNSNNLDALIAPTGSPAWKTDLLLGDHFIGGSSSLAAVAGYPAITVPMGFINELPVGISFFGRAWSEPVLIEIAYSYEQATDHRRAPGYQVSD